MAGCRQCQFNPADMRTKIEIQQLGDTPDGSGGVTRGWSTFATPWVKVEEKGGNEQLIGQGIDPVNTFIFHMRYVSNINEKMRIIHRGLTLQIKSVMQVEGLREFIKIKAAQQGELT